MIKVYRLEKEDKGIYQARVYFDYIEEIMQNYNVVTSPQTPAPHLDKGFKPHSDKIGDPNFYFGFASVQMMLNWFPLECIEELIEIGGASLIVFDVQDENVFSSQKQCVFIKGAAIEKTELKTFKEVKEFLSI
jgi:hypothetical protein